MERLARFADITISDPAAFGGGCAYGHVRTRVSTVAYGYLGVVEEYEDPDSTATWCLLTLSLPGLTPALTLDHRKAFGLPDVPAGPPLPPTGDLAFDAEYAVVAADPALAARILSPDLRALLVAHPIQRMVLSGSALVLRTFDGAVLCDPVIGALNEMVEGILSSTPSFVTPRSGRDIGLRGRPLAPGLYGVAEPADEAPPPRAGFAGRFTNRSRTRD